jgi:hypothetical protein
LVVWRALTATATRAAATPTFPFTTWPAEVRFDCFFVSFSSPLFPAGGWQYFFALTVILLFTSIIGAAAAFNFWRLLRQEDEGGDKYVYLAEAAY